MISHLDQAHAFVWVGHQDLLTEVLGFVAQRVKRPNSVVSLLQVEVGYIRVGVVFIASREWCLPGKKLEAEDSNCPQVNFIIVGLLHDEFGCYIVYGSTEGRPPLIDRVRGPTEVT